MITEDDMLANLARAKAEIDALGPYPRALWLVGCPVGMIHSTLYRLRASGIEIGEPWKPGSLPVCERATGESTEEDRKAGRWFLLMPGIWLEMSDGNHRWLQLEVKP